MSPLDVGHAESHHHALRVMRGLLVDGIDQVKGVLCEVTLGRRGISPNGKEFSAQISRARLIQADVAGIFGIRVADIVVFVEEALGRVGVRVYHDGGVVDLAGARADGMGVGMSHLCKSDCVD